MPDEMHRALKVRAASRGQSLNSYMLDILEREVARPTVAEVLERAASRAERATGSAVNAVDAARRERDAQQTRDAGA